MTDDLLIRERAENYAATAVTGSEDDSLNRLMAKAIALGWVAGHAAGMIDGAKVTAAAISSQARKATS